MLQNALGSNFEADQGAAEPKKPAKKAVAKKKVASKKKKEEVDSL